MQNLSLVVIYRCDGLTFHSVGGGGRGLEILLAAPRYRNEPDITAVLTDGLTCVQTVLCKIVIALKFHIYNRASHFD